MLSSSLGHSFPVHLVADSRFLMGLFWSVSVGISMSPTAYMRRKKTKQKKQGSHRYILPWVLSSLATSLPSVHFSDSLCLVYI